MRPHVCIPSGCQQWVSRTVAVGIDKFAYMSSLAIYVYSSHTYLPLAILAKHEQHLTALALSPFDPNLLACAIGNSELRVYDVDSELTVCSTKYSGTKAKVSTLEWHRSNAGVLLLAIGSHLVAWDFGSAMDVPAAGRGAGQAAAAADSSNSSSNSNPSSSNGAVATSPQQPSPPPSSPGPRTSLLARFKHQAGIRGSLVASDGAPGGAGPGRWVLLRDLGSPVTAFDQCAGGGTSPAGCTTVAVATADARVVLLELEPSGMGVRSELRTITLPDAAGATSGVPGIGPASAVAWEPLSSNGLLLVVGRGGCMALYDANSGEAVLQYAKQPATATRFARFLPSQPGNFLLSSSRSGALQLWNVSQPQPLRLFKLGGGLVQGFALLGGRANGGRGSGGGGAAAGSGAKRTAALVSFGDGALYVYDLDSQQVLWRQEGGHTETAFDCRFSTTDPNLLATASFDSSVRVWDVRTARCVRHLLGAEGILYSVSWSADGTMLAASSDSGVIYLYDYALGMLVKTIRQHSKESLKVVFHPHKPTLLASASVDGIVCVYTTDGETVRTLRHHSTVSCIAWGVRCPNLLATTSEEGVLHVWDVNRPSDHCLVRTLSRHSSRTFNVEFSPLLKHHLLSSSNDHTARVWDVSTGDCLAVLQGHTAQVRAVAWHPEIAHMCFTGSWDATVRVWDVRTGMCLHVAHDHHADVYGIACHPQRPFFVVTCSRDTTLRLWSTLDLTPHILPQALVKSIADLRAPAEEAIALPLSAPAVLSGSYSRQLADRLAAPACTPLERFAAITDFFLPPVCVDVLWDLARCARGSGSAAAADGVGPSASPAFTMPPSLQRPSGADAAVGGCYALHHWTTAHLAVGSAANHLELAACSKSRAGGAVRREDLLREAAQQHLVAGNVEHCCELLAELGDWDRALALAPVVGLAFWQRLMRKRVQALAEAESQNHISDVLPLYLVSGHLPALVDMLSASSLYDTAFNVAAVQACGGYQNLAAPKDGCNAAGGGTGASPPVDPPPPPPLCSPLRPTGANEPSAPDVGIPATPLSPQLPGPERARSARSDELVAPEASPGFAAAAAVAAAAAGSTSGASWGLPPSSVTSPTGTAASPLPSLPSIPSLPPLTSRGGALPAIGRPTSARPPALAALQVGTASTSLQTAHSLPLPAEAATGATAPASQLLSQDAGVGSPRAALVAAQRNLSGDCLRPLALPPASASTQAAAAANVTGAAPPAPLLAPSPPAAGGRGAPSARYRGVGNSGGGGGGGGSAPPGPGATGTCGPDHPDRGAFDRAVQVRHQQARVLLLQGLPLQAASCALSVDDVPGAVGLLLRGGQEELALALVMGLTRPISMAASEGGEVGLSAFGVGLSPSSGGHGRGGVEAVAAGLRPRVLVAAAQRREAAEDYLTAAELLKQVPGRSDLKQLLAGRCLAHAEGPTAARVFSTLGLQDPASYTAAFAKAAAAAAAAAQGPGAGAGTGAGDPAPTGAGWESVRRLLLVGQQPAAADRALLGVRKLIAAAERVTLTSADWEQAWASINSLSAPALDPAVWAKVFSHAVYVGAMVAFEQGSAAVGLYLVRVLEAWVADRADAELPVSQARLAAEVSEALDACLALPAYGTAAEAEEALAELAAAPQGNPWMQGMLQSRLSNALPQLLSDLASPTSPSHGHGGRSAGGGSASGGPEGLPSPPSVVRRLAAGSFTTGSASSRLSSLELGASVGRLISGGALATALSALQPSPGLATVGENGAGGAPAGQLAGNGSAASATDCRTAGPRVTGLTDLARGPVVVAAAHVPSRSLPFSSHSALPRSPVSGAIIRGAALLLDDGTTRVSLSEAVALRRVMAYSPTGSGKLLRLN